MSESNGNEILQILQQMQMLQKIYSDQFKVLEASVVAMQVKFESLMEDMRLKNEQKHQNMMEEIQASTVARQATLELLATLDQSIENLQQATLALINLEKAEQSQLVQQ